MKKIFDKINVFVDKLLLNKIVLAILIFYCLMWVYPNYRFVHRYLPFLPKLLLRLLAMSIIYFLFLLNIIKSKKIDLLVVITMLFSLFQIIINIYNNLSIYQVVYVNLLIANACLLINYIFIKIDKKIYFLVATLYFDFLSIINLIWGLMNDGYNNSEAWFFENRNFAFFYFIPLLFCSIYNYYTNKNVFNKFLMLFSNLLVIFTIFYSHSLSAIIVLTFAIPYLLFFLEKRILIFNIYTYLCIIILEILFIIPPISNIGIFSNLFILFGKDSTASGRLIMYKSILKNINIDNILFGHGFGEEVYYSVPEINCAFAQAHSLFIEIIYRFGLIGVFFSITILVICIFVINKSKNYILVNLSSFFIFIMLFWGMVNILFYFNVLFMIGLFIYSLGSVCLDINTKKIVYNTL